MKKHIFENNIEKKHCPTCKNWKQLSDFNKQSSSWDNLARMCRLCNIEYKKNKRENDPKYQEKDIEYNEKYKSSGRRKEVNRIRYIEKREEIIKQCVAYEKDRKKIDPKFKLMKTLRSRLYNALKRKSAEKCSSTMELIGCSVNFLKKYIEDQFEDGMTWENHGLWHIDHRKPCSSFNLTKEQQQKECFHYTNLQPLWAKDNLSKGSKDPITWESLNNRVI